MDLDTSIAFWKSKPDDERLADTVERWKATFQAPDSEESKSFQEHIVCLTFFAPAEVQWRFVLIAAQRLDDADHIGHFAAGPLEGFLGRFGEEWIDRLADECESNLKLRHALRGVWQHQMSDETYKRVKALAAELNS